jgi:hypothetical protein
VWILSWGWCGIRQKPLKNLAPTTKARWSIHTSSRGHGRIIFRIPRKSIGIALLTTTFSSGKSGSLGAIPVEQPAMLRRWF